MPFSTTGSVISTDLDNMVRGLYRDNSDSALTGTVAETTLKSISIAANTIGPTGALHVIIAGTITGVAGTKTIRLKFGTFLIAIIVHGAGTQNAFFIDTWLFNTATNAQRYFIQKETNDALTSTFDYGISVIDTTQNQTLALTGTLGNAGDTIKATMMDVFVVQIT